MKQFTTHEDQLVLLKKIEGQIRGVSRMISENRYCVDILNQLHSIVGAIFNVEDNILRKHIEGCVVGALKGKSIKEREKKINEVMELLRKFRRGGEK